MATAIAERLPALGSDDPVVQAIAEGAYPDLTPRDFQAVYAAYQGFSASQIARYLHVSPQTARKMLGKPQAQELLATLQVTRDLRVAEQQSKNEALVRTALSSLGQLLEDENLTPHVRLNVIREVCDRLSQGRFAKQTKASIEKKTDVTFHHGGLLLDLRKRAYEQGISSAAPVRQIEAEAAEAEAGEEVAEL